MNMEILHCWTHSVDSTQLVLAQHNKLLLPRAEGFFAPFSAAGVHRHAVRFLTLQESPDFSQIQLSTESSYLTAFTSSSSLSTTSTLYSSTDCSDRFSEDYSISSGQASQEQTYTITSSTSKCSCGSGSTFSPLLHH